MSKPNLFDAHPLPWRQDAASPWLLRDGNGGLIATFEARDQWGSMSPHNDDMCAHIARCINYPPGSSFVELQAVIQEWADTILPGRTVENVALKLIEESLELIRAMRTSGSATEDELADVFILALDLAGLTNVDIAHAVLTKMEVNRRRTWHIRPDGTAQHA